MRHAVEVGLDRAARHALEGGLGAEHARRPVGLRVDAAEQPEQRLADAGRQRAAHALFHQVHAVAAVAAEGLVAAVARQRHRDVLARQLADAVGRDRRAVGIGLVVQPGQGVDEVEVVALHGLDEVVGAGSGRPPSARTRDSLKAGSSKAIEQVFTGVSDRPGHRRDDGAAVDAAGQEGAQRHLGDHAQPHRFASAARAARRMASSALIGLSSVKRTSQ